MMAFLILIPVRPELFYELLFITKLSNKMKVVISCPRVRCSLDTWHLAAEAFTTRNGTSKNSGGKFSHLEKWHKRLVCYIISLILGGAI